MVAARSDQFHLVLLPAWYPSPEAVHVGSFIREQGQAIARRGHRVGIVAATQRSLLRWRLGAFEGWRGRVVTREGGLQEHRHFGWVWVPLTIYPNFKLWKRSMHRLFDQYVKSDGLPDILHGHASLYGGVVARDLAREYGLPYVVTEHDSVFAEGRLRSWQRPMAEEVLRDASACVVVSAALGATLERVFPGIAKYVVVPNMLGPEFDVPLEPRNSEPNGPFMFLSVGELVANKAHADLISAFEEVKRRSPGAKLRLVGDGPLRGVLEKMVRQADLSGQVEFLGSTNRKGVADEMRSADALVLSSHHETFSIAIIEAMSRGLPIVATACGGPNTLVEEHSGILVPPGSPKELAEAMISLRRNFDRFDRFLIHSRCRAMYGQTAVVSRLEDVYWSVLRPTS